VIVPARSEYPIGNVIPAGYATRRLLLVVVLIASLGPVQRATAVDPVEAIRAE